MARPKKKDDSGAGEVKAKDFEFAKKLYLHDIAPAKSKAAEYMQEASTAYKAIKKQAHIQPSAVKAAIKVIEMEDAARDDWLRGFNGFLIANNVDPDPKDMVDQMQVDDGYARPKPQLVAVDGKPSDGTETDLVDAAEEPFEMSAEELAGQEGRGERDDSDED